MTRILIFLLSVLAAVYAITVFAYLDGRIAGEAFGYKFDGPAGLIIGGFFALLLIVIYATHVIKNLMAMPAKLKAREKEARRARGVTALTRGFEALAAGDAAGAAHHAKTARNQLEDVSLTQLLTAQAAQISGDETAARESFSKMLEAPETEFVGLKGLFLQAMSAGDQATARGYAERAFRLRPNARWAFESVFELGLERGAWGETRDAVAQARRNKVVSAGKADRATAALLTADAYASALTDDQKTALSEAQSALKLAPGFTPAALLAVRLLAEAGKKGKAAKAVEAAFAAAPHPALIKAFDLLYADDDHDIRADKLRKLSEKNATSREAILLKARAAILNSEWESATDLLEPLLIKAPMAAEFTLMADALAGQQGPDAARPWLERAANAPRDPRPGADGEFHFTRDGWAQLVREFMEHERLAPAPLEKVEFGMSSDEIKLLIAPPVAVDEDEIAADAASVTSEPQEVVAEGAVDEGAAVEEAPDADNAAADDGDDDHIHNDEEAARAAAAAREVS